MKIDTTQPHVGRIYDYVLGGHHNYEVDRQAAERVLRLIPSYPKWAKLNRWFLQLVGSKWAEAGHNAVFDLASGLPTQGHFNEWLQDARILFSDNDPLNVTYGEQLLAGKPNMKYVLADLREPEPLLESAAAFFGRDRKLAVGGIGILYLLSDDTVRRLMQQLHAFCAPGSVMALSFMHVPEGPNAEATRVAACDAAKIARVELHSRSPEHMAELIMPWRVSIAREADAWLDIEDMLTPEEVERQPLRIIGAMAEH